VSQLDRRLLHPARFINPFSWMNPTRIAEVVSNVAPGVVALIEAALSGVNTGRVPAAASRSLRLAAR
jgi:hypothetical protein